MRIRIDKWLRRWRLVLGAAGVLGLAAVGFLARAEDPNEFLKTYVVGAESPEPRGFILGADKENIPFPVKLVGTAGAWGQIIAPRGGWLVPLDAMDGAELPPTIRLQLWCILAMGGYGGGMGNVEIPGYFVGFQGPFAVYWPGELAVLNFGSPETPDVGMSASLAQAFAEGGENGGFLCIPYVHVFSPDLPGLPECDNSVVAWQLGGWLRWAPLAPPNQPPVAKAAADKTTVLVGQPVQFRGDQSTDPEGGPLDYHWEFGDGTSSDLANPQHTYEQAGDYQVALTVHDQGSLVSIAELTIRAVEVTIKTRRIGAAGWDAGVTAIAVGGVASDVHRAEVEVTTNPATAGFALPVNFSAGRYAAGRQALLYLNGVSLAAGDGGGFTEIATNTEGKLAGWLQSSDVLTSAKPCTVAIGKFQKNVDFVWSNYAGLDKWQPQFPLIEPGQRNPQTVTLKLDNAALDGHALKFYVEKVTYVDAQGVEHQAENLPQAPQDMSEYAEFNPDSAVTDVNGKASATLIVKAPQGKDVVGIRMAAYDLNARKVVGGQEVLAARAAGLLPDLDRTTSCCIWYEAGKPRPGLIYRYATVPVVSEKLQLTKSDTAFLCTFRVFLNEAPASDTLERLTFKVGFPSAEPVKDEAQFINKRLGTGLVAGKAYASADFYAQKAGEYLVEVLFRSATGAMVLHERVMVLAVAARLSFDDNGPILLVDEGVECGLMPLGFF